MDQCTPYVAKLHESRVSTMFNTIIPEGPEHLPQLLSELQHLYSMQLMFVNGYSLMETTHQYVNVWPQSWTSLSQSHSFNHQLVLTVGQCIARTLSSVYNGILSADIYEDEDFTPSFRHVLPDMDTLDVQTIRQQLSSLKLQLLQSRATLSNDMVEQQVVYFLTLCESTMMLFCQLEVYIHRTIVIATRLNRERKQPSTNGASQAKDYRQLRHEYQQEVPKLSDLHVGMALSFAFKMLVSCLMKRES